MSDKKFQIFVSSTYKDLIDTRKKVIDAILRLEHFPVGMEWFSASDEEQWEIIENELKTTDYYILILGQRYGTLNSEGIGYTEKEYNYAREMGIPVLSFVRNENAPYTNDEREEKRDGQKRIKLFREKVLKESMVDFWETPEELVSKVLVALNKQIKRAKRIGWVRGDQAMSADMANELARLSKENNELRDELSSLRKNKEDISINERYYKAIEKIIIFEAYHEDFGEYEDYRFYIQDKYTYENISKWIKHIESLLISFKYCLGIPIDVLLGDNFIYTFKSNSTEVPLEDIVDLYNIYKELVVTDEKSALLPIMIGFRKVAKNYKLAIFKESVEISFDDEDEFPF